MNKYNPLWEYVKNSNKELIQLTFEEIQKLLGFPIDHSFLTFKKELVDYGFEVKKISLKEKTVTFQRLSK